MITELKPTNLIAVEVAPDASNYTFGKDFYGQRVYCNDIFYDTKENVWNAGNIILPEGKYKILGDVTKDKIGFDVEPYVEKVAEMGKKGTNSYGCLYMNYLQQKPIPVTFTKGTKEESFYSLLAANGLVDFDKLLILEKSCLRTFHFYGR